MSDQIRSYFDRWQRLEEAKAEISEDLKMVLARLRYHPDTGVLIWRDPGQEWFADQRSRSVFLAMREGKQAGSVSKKDGYVRVFCAGHSYLAHRLIWALIHGGLAPDDVDHINGNRADNRLVNLRAATRKENSRNRRIHKNNRAGVKGVYWHKAANGWVAAICVSGRAHHLGIFQSKKDAADAYSAAAAKLFGDFARIA